MARILFVKLIIISTLSIVLAVKDDGLTNVDNLANITREQLVANAFDGVYTECFLHLSYSCLQKKTLLYLNELDSLSEVTVVGDYLKFVKVNKSVEEIKEENEIENVTDANSAELSVKIDEALDRFFKGHVMKISAMGKEIYMPNTVEEFVGRKRKGGGGGGGGHHEGGDGGKKKMMMMAMMCMKMKMMMMIPAMMGMMGMMSFKGMMFSMMSFMISKMMLLMKLLEKKNSLSGSGGGADGGWAAGGGGGAWMPAGPDYGGGGGYDANAQWQQRSIILKKAEKINIPKDVNGPIISYIKPGIRYNGVNIKNVETVKEDVKIRKKRGVIDILHSAYNYWINKMLGLTNKKAFNPKMKVVNGMKYVYYPTRPMKTKAPKEIQPDNKPIIIVAEDFNKGEIMDVESRMIGKKAKKFMKNVNDTVDENPWD